MKVNAKDDRLPDGYRMTSDLRESGEWSMDTANEEYILALLRGLAPDVKEGKTDGSRVVGGLWKIVVIEDGDWFEWNGGIVYKCPLDDNAFKEALRRGFTSEPECPVLDALLEIKRDLADYPVLDDERYDELVTKHWVEEIRSSAPSGVKLSEREARDIYYALIADAWPPDDPNDQGIPAKYQVEFSGDSDYHIHGNSFTYVPGGWKAPEESIDLDACVEAAMKALKIRTRWNRRRR